MWAVSLCESVALALVGEVRGRQFTHVEGDGIGMICGIRDNMESVLGSDDAIQGMAR